MNVMRTVTKSFSVTPGTAAVKFRDGGEDLAFTAIVSRFGNVDSQGEVVDKGAFAKSLEARGGEAPVVWAHEWADPFNYIGVAKCSETEDGLYVEATLDGGNPTARQVHRLMQLGVVKEFSFSAAVEDGYMDDDGVPHLTQLDLFEVGPCLVGANRETSLETVSASGQADIEKEATVAEETAPATEAPETTAPADEPAAEVETTPGLAELIDAINSLVQAQSAPAPAPETSEPEPSPVVEPEPVTETVEPEAPEEPEEDATSVFAQSLQDIIADGLDNGHSATDILVSVVETLDSRVSGGKEDK